MRWWVRAQCWPHGAASRQTGPDRNTVSLGYDYNLSRRTDIYAVAMRDKLDNLLRAAATQACATASEAALTAGRQNVALAFKPRPAH